MYTTTLSQIRLHNPCTGGWAKLLKTLGKTQADDDPVPLSLILQSNGLEDAIWTLRCLEGADREIRLFAVEVARQVQHIMTDQRSLEVLEVAERFANGRATSKELGTSRAAAQAAAQAASWATADAAQAAADAAQAAGVAQAAARAAARAAAADADAAEAAWDEAWDAARVKQAEIFLKYFGE